MKKPSTILVVEDEQDIQQLLTYNLTKAGYLVTCADDGETALRLVEERLPQLIILDLMLPGINGLEVCKHLRSAVETINVPVLMLTACGEDEDIVIGLDTGADDYLPKPFSPKILLARIAALLRRTVPASQTDDAQLYFPAIQLTLDFNLHECRCGDMRCGLTSSEFAILKLLASRPGWVYSRQQIIDAIRGFDYCLTSRAIDVQISGLRKKLGKANQHIQTVRGVGYRFSLD